jgi:hypothetical protein
MADSLMGPREDPWHFRNRNPCRWQQVAFWALPVAIRDELDRLIAQVCRKVLDLLRRYGLWPETEENEGPVNPLLG